MSSSPQRYGEVSLDPLRWGLIPYWCSDPKGGRKPINAKCETVRDLPTFRDAYRMRRCIVPVDGFFEWKAIKGQKAKQPYATAMKDGAPFGIAGIWENWKEPASGEWVRTFAIITTDANEPVADIHDRMPVIIAPDDYGRWLGEGPDPRGLLRPFPADLMCMWPISTRVNKPENDDPSIVEPIEVAADAAEDDDAAMANFSVWPCVAFWISSRKPCAKPRSCEWKSLPALRRLLASLAARRDVLLFLPKCCLTHRGI
jgi:putative SOS response-associated peptidase YedK